MTRICSILAIAIMLAASSAVNAQTYADVSGSDLTFTNIMETSGGNLFGQPSANGNDLDFPATAFNAQGVDGAVDFLNGTLELTASSNTGMTFSSVSLDEFGVYFNTGDSISSVDAFLTVITPDGTYTDSFSFDFADGAGSWTGQAFVSFPETTTAEVFLHNILLADSVPDEVASINKRDVSVTFGTVIPEPSTFGLLVFGAVGLVSRRRR